MNEFIVQLVARLDATKTADDIKKIERLLNAKGIKLKPVIDSAASTQEIKNIAKQLQSVLSSQNVNIDTSKIVSALKQVSEATSKIYKTSDLDKQGKVYIQRVSNTIEKTKSEITSKMKSAGYFDIEIKGIEKANGQIKSLTVSATDAAGVLKQLTFAREKILGGGKTQSGFIQTDDVKILGNISNLSSATSAQLDNLKTKWSEQGILVGEFKNKVEQLEVSLSNVSSKGSLETLQTQLKNLNIEADRFSKANKIQLSIDTGSYETKYDSLIAKTREWTNSNGESRISVENLKVAYDSLTAASVSMANTPSNVASQQALIQAEQKLNAEIQTVTNSVRSMNAEFAKDATIASLHNKVDSFISKNGAAMRKYGAELKSILNETAKGSQVTTQRMAALSQQFNTIGISARSAGVLGKTLFQTLIDGAKKFSYWTSSTFVIMTMITKVRNALTELKEINSVLTEISKTNEKLSNSQLKQLGSDSFETGSKYGRKASDYLSGVQETSRAGYSNAEEMAELSVLAQSAGDMTAELANKYLIATDAAYKLEGQTDALNKVLDGQNYITNRNALSMSDLAEATKVAASQAASSSVEVNEMSAAVGTMIATTQQGGDIAGRAFKAILMNIQQVEGELDDGEIIDADQLTKYESAAEDLGVKLKEVKNGYLALRDPMEVLKELSQAYTSLEKDDARRANLISAIGGRFYHVIQKCITRMNLIAGNALEPCTTI